MNFTRNERLFLLNQYKILEKLDPNGASDYVKAQRIVSDGYAAEYPWLAPLIAEDAELTVDQCREVMDVLDMYDQLIFSYEGLADKSGMQPVTFLGFSGNEETAQMGYAKFLVRDGRWARFKKHEMNSHIPLLPQYRSMIAVWKALQKNFIENSGFSKQEIAQILDAGRPNRS